MYSYHFLNIWPITGNNAPFQQGNTSA